MKLLKGSVYVRPGSTESLTFRIVEVANTRVKMWLSINNVVSMLMKFPTPHNHSQATSLFQVFPTFSPSQEKQLVQAGVENNVLMLQSKPKLSVSKT